MVSYKKRGRKPEFAKNQFSSIYVYTFFKDSSHNKMHHQIVKREAKPCNNLVNPLQGNCVVFLETKFILHLHQNVMNCTFKTRKPMDVSRGQLPIYQHS